MPGIPNQTATAKSASPENPRLWDREMTRAFFGGIDVSTLYRGVHAGRYPRPVNVSNNVVRWLAEECEATLDRMIAARNDPQPPQRRGRPARRNAARPPKTHKKSRALREQRTG